MKVLNNNNTQKTCTLIDVAISADRNVVQKEAETKLKYEYKQDFKYGDTTNLESEIYDYTSYNWSYWNSNAKLKEKSGSYIRKTFDRFTTAGSFTWNITHNTESTAV
jgi:hypothetical protein